jgi:TPR repeat protein
MSRHPLVGVLVAGLLAGCPSTPDLAAKEVPMTSPEPALSPFPAAQQAAAERGVPEAQCQLGLHLERQGDHAGAARWLQKAAAQGYAPAQGRLAFYHRAGWGVPEDPATTFKLATQAAEAHDAEGQYQLGYCYWQGYGVAPDGPTALAWYRRAADQHHGLAERQLGVFYADGILVKPDRDQARAWFQRAAVHGEPDALETCRIKLDMGILERIYVWLNAT